MGNAIEEETSGSQSAAYRHFLWLERERLIHIIKEWLNVEKERLPFTVLEHEAERHIKIGPLSLRLKIDRIDKLDNGRQIIIDYKTGLIRPMHWFSNRPSEPQLPLYCVYGINNAVDYYSGIAYAQVHAGKLTFKGIIEEGLSEPPAAGIVSIDHSKNTDGINNWQAMLTHWKKTLEQLSHDFHSGVALLDPLESACTYCELQPLCRIREAANG